MKVMTIRIDDLLAEQIEAVARVNGQPAIEEIREALAVHVRSKSADPEFRERLKASLQRNQEVLASLMEDGQSRRSRDW